jgi:predicted enzyme related to lactoylglutathione lyase
LRSASPVGRGITGGRPCDTTDGDDQAIVELATLVPPYVVVFPGGRGGLSPPGLLYFGPAGGRVTTMSVSSVHAILLISDDAQTLAAFYRDAVGLPITEERHDGIPLHWGCDLGPVHFAIHPSEDWPGTMRRDAQSPVVIFTAEDVHAAYDRLREAGVDATPPFDHGFAVLTAFEDPDGNNVQILRPT